jgi:hypothetical protein
MRKFAAWTDPLDREHRESDHGDERYQSTLENDLLAHRHLSSRAMRMKRD